MALQNEHGRLIAAAAKAALAPIGCVRCGQSRVWLSDQRYWAIMIEFQPSGFSKGSYLNIGASWLWQAKNKGELNFDVGYRIEDAGFIAFENAEQFHPLVTRMASQAVEAVLALRAKFSSIAAISSFLSARSMPGGIHKFHAAVAAGLSGKFDDARSLFLNLQAAEIQFEWQAKLHAEAATLAALLNDPPQFRSAVRQTIDSRRTQARLPPLADCFDGADLPIAGVNS